MKKAIIYTLAFLVVQLIASTTVRGIDMLFEGKQTVMTTGMQIIAMVLQTLITVMLFCGLRWAEPTRSYLLSHPWDVFFWCVIAAFGSIVPSMFLQEQMPELPNVVEQQLSDIMSHRGGYFVICLLAPVAEELVFRGAVLRALLAWKPQRAWGMIAISAVLFSLAHINPAQMPHAFIMGLLLGWLYWRTGSIAPGIAFHWANNTVAYLLFRAYPDPSLRLIDILGGQQRSVAAAIAFSLLILLPALYQLHVRMKRV